MEQGTSQNKKKRTEEFWSVSSRSMISLMGVDEMDFVEYLSSMISGILVVKFEYRASMYLVCGFFNEASTLGT